MARWRRRIRAFLRVLLREHATPGRIAAAVFVGCLIGTSPLFGFHLALSVVCALVFRLNRIVVYGAANLSVPPMIPILGFASVQAGEWLRNGAFVGLSKADFAGQVHQLAARFFVSWLVGGFALGVLLGTFGAALAWVFLRRRALRASASGTLARRARAGIDPYSLSPERQFGETIGGAIRRASRRYRAAPIRPRFSVYARVKFRLDPCYGAIAALVPPGARLLDLGTGLGMLPVVVGELGQGRSAVGIEWDQEKSDAGGLVAREMSDVVVEHGDVRRTPLPESDVIVLADLLHYWSAEEQRELLERACAALAPGGRLLIREADPSRSGWARWTRAFERFVVHFGWNRGPAVAFRPVAELRSELRALGFVVVQRSVAGPFHPGNVLLTAELDVGVTLSVAPVRTAPGSRGGEGLLAPAETR